MEINAEDGKYHSVVEDKQQSNKGVVENDDASLSFSSARIQESNEQNISETIKEDTRPSTEISKEHNGDELHREEKESNNNDDEKIAAAAMRKGYIDTSTTSQCLSSQNSLDSEAIAVKKDADDTYSPGGTATAEKTVDTSPLTHIDDKNKRNSQQSLSLQEPSREKDDEKTNPFQTIGPVLVAIPKGCSRRQVAKMGKLILSSPSFAILTYGNLSEEMTATSSQQMSSTTSLEQELAQLKQKGITGVLVEQLKY